MNLRRVVALSEITQSGIKKQGIKKGDWKRGLEKGWERDGNSRADLNEERPVAGPAGWGGICRGPPEAGEKGKRWKEKKKEEGREEGKGREKKDDEATTYSSALGSTIGAGELNGRVRDGNGCGLLAIITSSKSKNSDNREESGKKGRAGKAGPHTGAVPRTVQDKVQKP